MWDNTAFWLVDCKFNPQDRTKKSWKYFKFNYPASNVVGLRTENFYWLHMRGFCFVPIRSDPTRCLFSGVEISFKG
jgi:hypothetical protein